MSEEAGPPLRRGQQPQSAQSGLGLLGHSIVCVLVGASLGPAVYFLLIGIEKNSTSLFSFAIGFFIAAGIALIFLSIATLLIIPRVFRGAKGTLDSIVSEVTLAGRQYADSNNDAAIQHVSNAVQNAAAWYAVGSARRLAGRSAVGLIFALGGTLGSVLLLTQNSLLRQQTSLLQEQNNKLDQQTFTAEAQRRGALSAALFDILKDVASNQQDQKAGGTLSEGLQARIVALSRATQPYLFIETKRRFNKDGTVSYLPETVARPLSPERGQLLVGLVAAGANLQELGKRGMTVGGADLRGSQLDGANLADLDLVGANFENSKLNGSNFRGANLTSAKFVYAKLKGADFSDALVDSTDFTYATLIRAKFVKSALVDVIFCGARLTYADFSETSSGFNGEFGYATVAEDLTRTSGVHEGYPKDLPRPPRGFREVIDQGTITLEPLGRRDPSCVPE